MMTHPEILEAIRGYNQARERWSESLAAVKALLDQFPTDDDALYSEFYRVQQDEHAPRVKALAAASDRLFGLLADRGYEAVLYLGRVYFRAVDHATHEMHLVEDADHSFHLKRMLILNSDGQTIGTE